MQQELFDPCTYQLFSQRVFCKHVNFLPAVSSLLLHVCVFVRACVRASAHVGVLLDHPVRPVRRGAVDCLRL